MVEPPGVLRDRERLLRIRRPQGELGEHELAHDHSAGRTDPLCDHRVVAIAPGRVEHERIRRRWLVPGGEDVLQAKGDTLEGPSVHTGREFGIGPCRLLGGGRVDGDERAELLVQGVDPAQPLGSEFGTRHLA